MFRCCIKCGEFDINDDHLCRIEEDMKKKPIKKKKKAKNKSKKLKVTKICKKSGIVTIVPC